MTAASIVKALRMKIAQQVAGICACISLLAGLAPVTAQAASQCVQAGGNSLCTTAVYRDQPSYDLCDDIASYTYRRRGWCEVRGGTWTGGNPECIGPQTAISAGNAGGLAADFELWIHGPSCGAAPPPGACTNEHCACVQVTQMGLITTDYSVMPFSGKTPLGDGSCGTPWAENVILRMTRPAGCPAGYVAASGDPDFPCSKPQICWECLGNPIGIGDGSKMQRELDYASPAPGGLRFERFYNSSGFYDVAQRDPTGTDYWRHTYSSRVIAYPANTYVMAASVRANGAVIVFKTNGVEFHNNDGAANRLLKQVDGGGNVTGWQLTTPDNDVEQYNAQGKLTTITTRSGFVTTLAYDGSGRLSTITDAYGRAITLGYDTSGNMTSMTDPSSRTYTYAYDAKGRLASVTYPDTRTRSYLYENSTYIFALTGIIDERGARISTYGYDSQGRGNYTEKTGPDNKFTLGFTETSTTATTTATDGYGTGHTYWFNKVNGTLKKTAEQWDSLGGWQNDAWVYDANGNLQSWTNRMSVTTLYSFDATRNLETSRTEANGTSIARTITTTWHSTYRLPATITEPSGVSGVNLVTTFTYDAAGNLTRKNMTAGSNVREWNYTVNSRGQVLTIDGPRTDVTDVTTIAYYGDSDSCVGCRGQVYTVTNAASQVTTFDSYDLDGRPTQITDANGVATTLTYKTRGWLASRSTAGETTSYDYDDAGNLTKVTLPDSSWISYEYDVAGALVGVGDNLGNSIDYELDVMGKRVEERVYDPNGALRKSLQRVYDAAQRLSRDVDGAANNTIYTYDGRRNLLTATDPLTRVTTNTRLRVKVLSRKP
jgi:YD repeat-containing protein